MMKHHEIAARNFNRVTLRRLSLRGITLVGSAWLPGSDGSYANGETGYQIDDNGTHKIRTFLQVVELASKAVAS